MCGYWVGVLANTKLPGSHLCSITQSHFRRVYNQGVSQSLIQCTRGFGLPNLFQKSTSNHHCTSKVGLIERRLFQEVADEFCINTDKLFKDLTRTIKKNIKAGWNVSHLLQKIYYIQKLSWCAINIYIQKHHIQKGQF